MLKIAQGVAALIAAVIVYFWGVELPPEVQNHLAEALLAVFGVVFTVWGVVKKKAAPTAPSDPTNGQAGYVSPVLLVLLAVSIVAAAAALSGCAQQPVPNQIQAATETLAAVVVEVREAKRAGYITAAERDDLLDDLQSANDLLKDAANIYYACEAGRLPPANCNRTEVALARVNQIVNDARLRAAEGVTDGR